MVIDQGLLWQGFSRTRGTRKKRMKEQEMELENRELEMIRVEAELFLVAGV